MRCAFIGALLQVAEVATKLEKLKKQGIPSHFVAVELRKWVLCLTRVWLFVVILRNVRWLPIHCAEHEVIALDTNEFPDIDKAKGRQFNKRFLDLSVWLMAWDRYAIGATLLKQLAFEDAQHHKAVVVEVCLACFVFGCVEISVFLQIAATAKSKGMGPLLGVIYDDIVRKQWEDLSMKLGDKWTIAEFVKAPQEDALRRAEVLYKSVILAGKV